jgi:glycosyltransferase involved in cell wall biosynthesis
MPILEAMACGAPVITSRTTGLAEVAGDAAILVEPSDARELAEAMVKVLESSSLRESLKAKGLVRVKQYSWHQAAAKTLELYSSLCQ